MMRNLAARTLILLLLFLLLPDPWTGNRSMAQELYDCNSEESRGTPTTIELTLAKKWRKDAKEIQKTFKDLDQTAKVRIEYFPFIDPPPNIAIGKCVSAEMARLAFREALDYNRGVEKVILQEVIPHHWIGIGTTKLAELSWMPITPEDLKELMEPSLSNEAFQERYRNLAKMRERKRPFGFDPVPYEPQSKQTTPMN
jgi:hypothetical protein